MSPRPRHPRNRGLPDNLRVRNRLYSYTHPLDGREKGLGRDRIKAIQFARSANSEIQKMRGELIGAEWARGTSSKSWGAWLTRFEQILAERGQAKATANQRKSMMKRARAQWPAEMAIAAIDTAMVADAIRELVTANKRTMAQAYRAYLHKCFKTAHANGWRTDNPVAITDAVTVKPKRARLTLEHFQAIYADPKLKPWLRNAMALALVSGQRREDIARAQRRDIRDGAWWVQQRKTGNRLMIPLGIRLDALGMSLAEVLEQCRSGILSHYIIHQTYPRYRGKAVAIRAFTNLFTAAVTRLGIDWGDKSPPTFHELRSLSKRLYDAQGGVDTKQLLGHRSAGAAALYGDARGEWVKVSVK
jgi:enterobacteria phage integrase